MHVRDEQVGAFWSPSDGAAYDGPVKGTVLRWNPYWQMTFSEYRELHPDGEVIRYEGSVDERYHRNPRHGHGADSYPGSPGVEPFFLASGWTLQDGAFDERLPENTLILGLNEPEALRVYPLDEVQRDGGVVHDRLGQRPIVVLSPYNSFTLAAYQRVVNGREIHFRREADRFFDQETGSGWTVEGLAVSGPLTGHELAPLEWQTLEWHSFASTHPNAEIYTSSRPPRLDPTTNPAFRSVVDALRSHGYRVDECYPLHPIWRAVASTDGLRLHAEGDRLELMQFEDGTDARDFWMLDGHDVLFDNFVLRSNPLRHFSNWAQTRLLRDKDVAWSPLLQDDRFLGVVGSALRVHARTGRNPAGAFDLLEDIRAAGYPVRTQGLRWYPGRSHDAGPCWVSQVPVKAKDGFRAVVDGDCFLVFRFADQHEARAWAATEPHCTLLAGWIVLRSDPPFQYLTPYPLLSYDAPVEDVKWSRLLHDPGLQEVCRAFGERWSRAEEAVR